MREHKLTQIQALDIAHCCFDNNIKRTGQLRSLDLVIAKQNPWLPDFPVLFVQRDRDLVASISTPRQRLIKQRLLRTIQGNTIRATSLMTKYHLTMEQIYQIHREKCSIR